MLKFAWRWMKVGDRVLVHDRHNLERDLMPGVVEHVTRLDGQTGIGVRLSGESEPRYLWPTPLFVHPDPLDADEQCRICDENDERTPASASASAAA